MMKHSKTLAAAAVFGAILMGSGTAEATVVEPDEGYWSFVATPGLGTAVASLVTTVGAASSLDAPEAQTGWAATGVVFGSLSVITGAVYGGFALGDDGESLRNVFIPTAAANVALGITSLALGIAAATVDAPPEERPWMPNVSVSEEGGFVGFSGSF
jgi:hypothetical protein